MKIDRIEEGSELSKELIGKMAPLCNEFEVFFWHGETSWRQKVG